jgi:hypothetical protein
MISTLKKYLFLPGDERIKLEAIKVKLLQWDMPTNNVLKLYFEKVPSSLGEVDPDNGLAELFTDHGYLQVNLLIDASMKDLVTYLDTYINNEDVFIEEEVINRLTFWDGQYIERYDWSSSYFISFEEISVLHIPLTLSEWKAKEREFFLPIQFKD